MGRINISDLRTEMVLAADLLAPNGRFPDHRGNFLFGHVANRGQGLHDFKVFLQVVFHGFAPFTLGYGNAVL